MRKLTIILAVLLLGNFVSRGQALNNRGTEFWVGYGHHQQMEDGSNTQEMRLYFNTDNQPARVKVYLYNNTLDTRVLWLDTLLAANIVFSTNPIPKAGALDSRLYTVPCGFLPPGTACGGEGLYKRAIQITSDQPIAAYAHIYSGANSGATMLLPVESWGYYYITANSKQNYASNCYSWMYVIAQHDSTKVEIIPSQLTRGGSAGAGIPAGDTFRIFLNRGETYQMMADGSSASKPEFTGTKVKSIANNQGECFPIAVFAGSSRTSNPQPCGSGGGDNDNQQCLPTQVWGKRYLTSAFSNGSGAGTFMTCSYKIIVKDPATVVRRNGVPLAGLVGNTHYIVEGSNQHELFDADKPIMVAQFMTGGACLNGGNIGDPEMIYLSPIEQGINKIGFFRNNRDGITVNYLSLIIHKNGVPSLRIDGTGLATFNLVQTHPRDTNYRVVVKRWTSAFVPATASSDSDFVAITYGLGSVESYGYNAGTRLDNLNAIPGVVNIRDTNRVTRQVTCANSPVQLVALFSAYQPVRLLWNLSEISNLIQPATNYTDFAPVPISVDTINGIIYYRYLLPGNYTFRDTGMIYVPVYSTHPTIDNCTQTERLTLPFYVRPRPPVDFSSSILNIVNDAGCITDSVKFRFDTSQVGGNGVVFDRWSWNFGDNTTGSGSEVVKLYSTPGIKQVTLLSVTSEGCVSDTTKPVTIYDRPTGNIIPAPLNICDGDSVTLTPLANYALPDSIKTWYWDFGNGIDTVFNNGNSIRMGYPGSGPVTVRLVTGVTNTCISDTATVVLNRFAKPNVNFLYPAGCLPTDGIVNFTAAATTPDGQAITTYSWEFGDPNANASNPNTSTLQNPTHFYSQVGNYSIKLTATTANGCSKDTTINATFNLKPALAFGAIPPVCGSATSTVSVANGSVTNAVPGSGIYRGPGTDASGNFNPSVAGSGTHVIWFVYTTNAGCIDSISQTVNVRAKPTVAFTYTNPVCLGTDGLVQFDNGSSVSDGQTLAYDWNFNDPNANAGNPNTSNDEDPSHNFREGTFNIKLTATTNFGCVNDTTIAVTFSVKPALDFPAPADRCQNETNGTSIATASVTNGVTGSGVYSGPGTNAAGVFTPSAAGSGTHIIRYVFTTAGGCVDSIQQTILVNPKPNASFTASSGFCQNETSLITDGSSIPGGTITTYNWYFGDGTGDVQANNAPFNHSFPSYGNYTVSLVAISDKNCISDTARRTVTVHALPQVSFIPPAFVCMPNGTAQFQNTSTAPDNAGLNYSWDFGDGTAASADRNPSHVYVSNPGSVNVTLSVTSQFGCFADTTIPFSTFYDKPIANFSVTPTELCQGVNNVFTDNSSAPNSTVQGWSWDFGDGKTSTAQSPTHRYQSPGVFDVNLIVRNAVGCESDPYPATVTVNLQPVVDAGWSFVVPRGTVITLAPRVNDSTVLSFLWTPQGDIPDPTILRPSFAAQTNQVYRLTATGPGNCSDSDTMYVKILDPLKIPNVFSPNGDNINDTWILKNLNDYPGASVQVFNRYGQEVFRSSGYPRPWDGTFNGKPLPVGTYYYIIRPRNEFEPLTGPVTIIR